MHGNTKHNWLLVLASLLVALLALEGGLRLARQRFSNQPDSMQNSPHLYSPYRSFKLNPAFNTKNNTGGKKIHSSDGFRRDAPIALRKGANQVRIFVMGASALYGIGSWGSVYPNAPYLANNETVTHYLEQDLNAALAREHAGYSAEVVNCGVTAYRTFQHLVYLNESLLKYAPDIVVNLDGHNDFYTFDPGFEHWGQYGYGIISVVESLNRREFRIQVALFFRWLAMYSAIADQIDRRLTSQLLNPRADGAPPVQAPADGGPAAPAERYALAAKRTYLRALWQINRLGQLEDYAHLVFLQPEVVLEDPARLTGHDRMIRDTTLRHVEGTKEVEEKHLARSLMPRLFADKGIEFHDLGEIAPLNRDGRDLYIDYCHLTPAGAKVVAGAMFPAVYAQVQKRIAARKASAKP